MNYSGEKAQTLSFDTVVTRLSLLNAPVHFTQFQLWLHPPGHCYVATLFFLPLNLLLLSNDRSLAHRAWPRLHPGSAESDPAARVLTRVARRDSVVPQYWPRYTLEILGVAVRNTIPKVIITLTGVISLCNMVHSWKQLLTNIGSWPRARAQRIGQVKPPVTFVLTLISSGFRSLIFLFLCVF